MILYNDYPLLAHNTFGMDVRANLFVEYASESAEEDGSTKLNGHLKKV